MITVTSPAFEDLAALPTRYTCDGEGISPPLAWAGIPEGTAALALVVDDPDAPRGTFTHWVVLDIPTTVTGAAPGQVPDGGRPARNTAGRAEWFPPCPPSGTHRYRFTVHSLGRATGLAAGAPLDDALAAITDLSTGSGTLTGPYRRTG